MNLFRVLLNNLKCHFCKEKFCNVRYLPERKKYYFVDGTRYVIACKKEQEKRIKDALNRKLP